MVFADSPDRRRDRRWRYQHDLTPARETRPEQSNLAASRGATAYTHSRSDRERMAGIYHSASRTVPVRKSCAASYLGQVA